MKKSQFIFLNVFFLILNYSFSQSIFEGKVSYKNTFTSKLATMTSEKFAKLIGSEQEYFISNGKYLSISNGQLTPVQLYKNNSNKIYTKTGNSDTIYCIDASKEKSKIIEIKIEETTETILGYKCKLLKIKTSNNSSFIFYFSDKLKINPEAFKNHSYNHWYSYLKEAKALPLKTILENKQFKMITEAVSVEQKQIPESKFELPKDAILKCN